MKILTYLSAIVFVGVVLAACAPRPEAGFLLPTEAVATGATDHTILIVSTRARDSRPDTLYDGERSAHLDYASATISVPPTHVAGQIEWSQQPPGDPTRDFVTRHAAYLDGAAGFDRMLKAELSALPKGHRDVVLFVHGYNTLFAEGLYRFAQLKHDVKGQGVAVLFTWASRGSAPQYIYDLNSATAARDALEATIRQLAASGADHVNIIAHSMGNWVTMEALRQIRMTGGSAIEDKLGLVALASPDIDVDVFKSEMRRYGKPKKPFIVLLSRDDHALELSTKIAGDKERVGDYDNDRDLANLGVVVVDLSGVKGDDASNHWKFTQSDAYTPEVRALLLQSGIALPQISAAQRSTPADKIGTSLGDFLKATTNVVVALPNALVGNNH